MTTIWQKKKKKKKLKPYILTLNTVSFQNLPVQQYHLLHISPLEKSHPFLQVCIFLISLSMEHHWTPFVNSIREVLCSLNPYDVVYTDGSKSDSSTGCAFVTDSREYMFQLLPKTSVYTADGRADSFSQSSEDSLSKNLEVGCLYGLTQ